MKADANYKRRVTWLEPAPSPFASVEYIIGHYPDGAAPHGNAKIIGEPYHRTDPSILDAIKEASGTTKPREIYERLKRKPTEEDRPKNLRQVQNTVYNAKKFGGRRKETSNREEKTLVTIFIIYRMPYMTIHLSRKYSTQNSTYQASCYSLQNKYKISGGSAALLHLGRVLSSGWTRPLTLVSYM